MDKNNNKNVQPPQNSPGKIVVPKVPLRKSNVVDVNTTQNNKLPSESEKVNSQQVSNVVQVSNVNQKLEKKVVAPKAIKLRYTKYDKRRVITLNQMNNKIRMKKDKITTPVLFINRLNFSIKHGNRYKKYYGCKIKEAAKSRYILAMNGKSIISQGHANVLALITTVVLILVLLTTGTYFVIRSTLQDIVEIKNYDIIIHESSGLEDSKQFSEEVVNYSLGDDIDRCIRVENRAAKGGNVYVAFKIDVELQPVEGGSNQIELFATPGYTEEIIDGNKPEDWYKSQYIEGSQYYYYKTSIKSGQLIYLFGKYCVNSSDPQKDISILAGRVANVVVTVELIQDVGLNSSDKSVWKQAPQEWKKNI